ncbi:thiamine pyrophosphate-dependent dehydrogenase E1 component subunit alpha [Tsuneonella flava]|uniref:Thiamine pyrophosphate-dependent dehydrogenase E1 component subunit alpha n=1 Tax=Tsuneonella flava TaxID=2055955 RepID=A0ABX7KB45_9SPHN|nr:thiamine pyrophosphate-dependent dehydrogenase E1 component subunit alpha [Tsuneonella flava]QSB45033.1 thiamine pyrophosphate-dependent dehydrogenase E1 component subunit alpha [Tsuneonella flava]
MSKQPQLSLGDLADPSKFSKPIDLDNRPTDGLLASVRDIMLIRYAEEAVAELAIAKEAVCPCHLGIGQEAVAAGVSTVLTPSDRVYGGHRSHAHFLALGGSVDAMFAEILGKVTGASKGMGGSMHLFEPSVGFHGSVPIVGATIPIAAGAALACKMDGKGAVAVAYFGDGACEEGVFHETLNMAAVMKLPVLFVAENNLYSSHLDIGQRQATDSVARFAYAAGIPTRVVDGNDVVAVAQAAEDLVGQARVGGGPGFIEAVTFRWRGHVGPNEDIDVGVRRSPEELAAWKGRDPLARLIQSLVIHRGVTRDQIDSIATKVRSQISRAVEAAREASYPDEHALLDLVYSSGRSVA